MFDPDSFVNECRAAVAGSDPVGEVRKVVESAVHDARSIDEALGAEFRPRPDTLFSSPTLTVQRISWSPGALSSRHEHRMWAVIGVYTGQELNHFYERRTNDLVEVGTRVVAPGDVVVLEPDVIHAVDNRRRQRTAGLHVYGGDIMEIERSAWGPDGHEVQFVDDIAGRTPMFQAMRELADRRGEPVNDDARFDALTSLWSACECEGRYLTAAEAREVISTAWHLRD